MRVHWAARAAKSHHSRSASGRVAAGGGIPLSASIPARAYEIDPGSRP